LPAGRPRGRTKVFHFGFSFAKAIRPHRPR